MLFVAQAASGLFMTSLEGLLDTSAAGRAGAGVTGALARATAGRAMGSAAATAVFPIVLASTGLTQTTTCVALALLITVVAVRILGRPKIDRSPHDANPSGESAAKAVGGTSATGGAVKVHRAPVGLPSVLPEPALYTSPGSAAHFACDG